MKAVEAGGPLDDLVAESERVLAAARRAGVQVRLAGGLAIRYLCPAARRPPLSRDYADLDLAITNQKGHRPLTDLMGVLGYEPNAMFNALNGSTRLYYNDNLHGRHVDVFVDAIRMCHVIDFKGRLTLLEETLTPSDLLLSKLQIVELNRKDVLDLISLLHDIPIKAGDASALDSSYLEQLWGNDWAIWRTCKETLGKIRNEVPTVLPGEGAARVQETVSKLEEILASGAKSLRWRLRARVGDRVRWYELPEEVG